MGDTSVLWVTLLNLKGGGFKPPHLRQDRIHKMCFVTDGGLPNLLLNLSSRNSAPSSSDLFQDFLTAKSFP